MQYTPFASDIELPFYTALASHKINHDKLNDSPPLDPANVSCRMQIHGNALTSNELETFPVLTHAFIRTPSGFYRAEGMIKNVNTIEDYRSLDKTQMIVQAGKTIWDAIKDGTIYSCPSLLSSFIIVSFADLKKYKFYYWFGFPALHSDQPWTLVDSDSSQAQPLSVNDTAPLVDAVQEWKSITDDRQHGFFLARKQKRASRPEAGSVWQVAALSEYENGFFTGAALKDRYICFADPSNYDHASGWMLRNLLVLVKQRWRLDNIQILRYRDTPSKRDQSRSTVIQMTTTSNTNSGPLSPPQSPGKMPKITGWERNPAGKLAGRISVDLNLKLMKWRISPTLNLERIKGTKCLLLGAGTLGSYVARNLLGWGVRKITFVDKGNVSFSNPVRQPLFTFQDCLNGGAAKATRASEALTEIYPGVDTAGHQLSVPMAGHPIVDEDVTRAEFEALRALIEEHDAIFLLMDTRESRWLPTVIGKSAGKIVMNAALGFDSYVVMRHGIVEDGKPADLGCYFCNDVVAPANSIKDQTLDQQCTVTRPGVAAIASALLVELLVSVLQHPRGAAAPAPLNREDDRGDHPLGLVPHQIRGFLATFENITVTGKSYTCCSACSETVTNEYKKEGWGFVRRALNEPGYVEELSGLKEVHKKAEAALANVDWEEPSDDEHEGMEIL
ncbi:Ubiquitin-like modifier-activating enzyme atg7 [Penicillium chermesinum]|uniref:Ubiquitin-like modifier-activating enzyme ATG7 n=1 Tax=Penicillium chermesinum TaxID=63820 RepID=A0A9W9N7Q3_9EURO|nr:Ubiquitin-like modifier-activating enzyme atg7 [Penicillium chermesinum]KAJ5214796.1 Ubiquitin-like modifier-activating enzyme atg7 [Penicillium chermesinum]